MYFNAISLLFGVDSKSANLSWARKSKQLKCMFNMVYCVRPMCGNISGLADRDHGYAVDSNHNQIQKIQSQLWLF